MRWSDPAGQRCASNLLENTEWSCGVTDGTNGNLVGVDPLLDPTGLQDNGGPTQAIALLPGSPAINAGEPEVCANPPVNGVDQRGVVRPAPGSVACSIGAFEYVHPTPTPTATLTATPTPTATPRPSEGDGGGCSVTLSAHGGAAWWLLLPPWLLLGTRRRGRRQPGRRRCSRRQQNE